MNVFLLASTSVKAGVVDARPPSVKISVISNSKYIEQLVVKLCRVFIYTLNMSTFFYTNNTNTVIAYFAGTRNY